MHKWLALNFGHPVKHHIYNRIVTALYLTWPTFCSTCYQSPYLRLSDTTMVIQFSPKERALWFLLILWDLEIRYLWYFSVLLLYEKQYLTWRLEHWGASSSTEHILKDIVVRYNVFIFAIYFYTNVGIYICTYTFV